MVGKVANYVAHYRKKVYNLGRKKRDLILLLERHGTAEELTMAAEAVRESQIRVLEAKRAQVPPCEANADRLRAIDEEIGSWLKLPVSDIIASYRERKSKLTGK